tara:strand:+ start:50 stop:439 length:390 start_codon:yes stop_codon:yes gene_type:complete
MCLYVDNGYCKAIKLYYFGEVKMDYKREEIKEHFNDFIEEQDSEWIEENIDDLHHHAFNNDYYIIGRYQATKWLGEEVFNIINLIKEWEQSNLEEGWTDFSEPERVVNMYTYIIGEEIVSDYINQLEVA